MQKAAPNKPAEGDFLREQARFLTPLKNEIAQGWQDLYLNTFGRGSYFSSQRVQKIFKELTEIFIDCLSQKKPDLYFNCLRQKGIIFSKLGVPFEEVIISIHLFEEVCTQQMIKSYADRAHLDEMVGALAELHSEGLAVLAGSYFETFKEDVKQITDSLTEENRALELELSASKEKFFSCASKELASMQLVMSGINLKMRNRLYQLSRLQKLSEMLDQESYLPKLLKLAANQLAGFCPKNSEVYFGFLDEEQKKINLYGLPDKDMPEADLCRIFFFSELTAEVQDLMFDESRKIAHSNRFDALPAPLRELVGVKNYEDFIFLPMRKFREAQGFIFVAAHGKNFFCKNNFKFFQRAGQIVSKAVVSALLFTKAKKQNEFTLLMEEITRKKYSRESLETSLDFCLGSLMDLMGAERTSLMSYDSHKNELRVCAAKGYKVYPISGHAFKYGEGIAGTALKESKIISIPKMKDHDKGSILSHFLSNGDAPEIKLKSLLCVPLLESKRPLGVVNISTINFYKDFDKSEIDMAHSVVNRMASILKEIASA